MDWFVYILQGRQGHFYCGITTDLERRVWEHNHDHKKASRCAWACRPLELKWSHPVHGRRAALRLEARIKRLTRPQKLALVKGEVTIEGLDN